MGDSGLPPATFEAEVIAEPVPYESEYEYHVPHHRFALDGSFSQLSMILNCCGIGVGVIVGVWVIVPVGDMVGVMVGDDPTGTKFITDIEYAGNVKENDDAAKFMFEACGARSGSAYEEGVESNHW